MSGSIPHIVQTMPRALDRFPSNKHTAKRLFALAILRQEHPFPSIQATQPGGARIELRDLEIRRVATRLQPYHRLEMDRPEQKTSFVFVDEATPDTLRGYRLAAQKFLAEGLNFKGGETEKVLYADL